MSRPRINSSEIKEMVSGSPVEQKEAEGRKLSRIYKGSMKIRQPNFNEARVLAGNRRAVFERPRFSAGGVDAQRQTALAEFRESSRRQWGGVDHSLGEGLADADGDGLALGDGDGLGEADGEALGDGESEGEGLGDGDGKELGSIHCSSSDEVGHFPATK